MTPFLSRQVSSQVLHYTCRRCANQHANIRHPPPPLLSKKGPISLDKLDKESLDLHLKVLRKQVHPAPLREIHSTQIEPDLLPLRPIYRPHPQHLRTLIKKSGIAEIRY